MYYIKRPFLLLGFIVSLNLNSQNDFESLGETAFSLNHSINSDYKINFSLRSRYFLYQESDFLFENRQLDFVHFSTYKLDYYHSLSLGIQYRLRESIDGGMNEFRIAQQFNYTKTNQAWRFGHTIRLEQRFFEFMTIIRARYRFAIDRPLNGEELNIGESYLIAYMEGLHSVSNKSKPEFGHRTTAQIGWLLSKKIKIQIGLEYRFEAINIYTVEKLFLLSSLILKV